MRSSRMSRVPVVSAPPTRRPTSALSRRPMRQPGFARSRRRPSADLGAAVVAAALLAATGLTAIADEGSLGPYAVVGDSIPTSLTGEAGDPARGREIVVDRQLGACLLCHTGPFPEERFQG